jgi:hypothetical protein
MMWVRGKRSFDAMNIGHHLGYEIVGQSQDDGMIGRSQTKD